jgi:hypothetical protein
MQYYTMQSAMQYNTLTYFTRAMLLLLRYLYYTYYIHLFLAVSLVSSLIHHIIKLRGIKNLGLDNPTSTLGVLIDGMRSIFELSVALNDLHVERSVDGRSSLDGLDGTEGLGLIEGVALVRELHVDNITERVLSVISNTNHSFVGLIVESHPLVVIREFCDGGHRALGEAGGGERDTVQRESVIVYRIKITVKNQDARKYV